MTLSPEDAAELDRARRDAEEVAARKVRDAVFRLQAAQTIEALRTELAQVLKEHGPAIARTALSIVLGFVV